MLPDTPDFLEIVPQMPHISRFYYILIQLSGTMPGVMIFRPFACDQSRGAIMLVPGRAESHAAHHPKVLFGIMKRLHAAMSWSLLENSRPACSSPTKTALGMKSR